MGSIPSSSIGSATASPWLAPKMTGATLMCWPTACAPIGTPFGVCRTTSQRLCSCASGRGWPTTCSRNALVWPAGRMREQLWRYYPQMLELADDLAADWFLDLWSQAPTPAKAVRLRETTIERFVKAHRLRRWQAPEVLRILKQKPLSVAPGVVEAASDHIRTLTVRIRLINQQLKAAHRKLDELCT